MSSEDLADMISLIMYAPISIDSVTVIRNGYIVLDAYFYPFQKDSAHVIHSCTKSITSTLIGIAIDKGYIKDVHHRLLDFFPELAPDNMTAAVGLDGVYRITELTEAKVAFKGRWLNENTFKFFYINVGHTQGPRGEFNLTPIFAQQKIKPNNYP